MTTRPEPCLCGDPECPRCFPRYGGHLVSWETLRACAKADARDHVLADLLGDVIEALEDDEFGRFAGTLSDAITMHGDAASDAWYRLRALLDDHAAAFAERAGIVDEYADRLARDD